jgi:hypothetical protein
MWRLVLPAWAGKRGSEKNAFRGTVKKRAKESEDREV